MSVTAMSPMPQAAPLRATAQPGRRAAAVAPLTSPAQIRTKAEGRARLPDLGPWQHAVWPAHRLNRQACATWATGHDALDAELPGGGWPVQGLTELLLPPHQHLEWRLLAPALRQARRSPGSAQAKRPRIALIGAPFEPHLPGLLHEGLEQPQWVRIDARDTRERLWACEQLLRSRAPIAILCWLPEADAAALRRLQSLAQGAQAPCFIIRPLATREQASPAPLRLSVKMGDAWKLQVQVLKRQGPPMAEPLQWRAQPGSLQALWPLTPQGSLPSLQPLGRPSRAEGILHAQAHTQPPAPALGATQRILRRGQAAVAGQLPAGHAPRPLAPAGAR